LVAPLPWAREQNLIHQAIILQEAHDHPAQEPGGRHLRQQTLAPDLEGFPNATSFFGSRVFALQGNLHGHYALCPLLQIVFEARQHTFEVIQQTPGVNHRYRPCTIEDVLGCLASSWSSSLAINPATWRRS
jgi:hypothetical protein